MGFHGSQGFFRFRGATSIPQKEVGISGDSRYTRAFIDREPITIHLPFTPTQSAGLRGDIPEGHSLPWSYVQQYWNRTPGIPNEFYDRKFVPDLAWNSYGSLQRLGEHVFLSESDGNIILIRNPVLSGTTRVNAGIPALYDDGVGVFLSIPYLWGSEIEGIHSGARRFIVGPTKNPLSNPFYGEYDSSSLDPLGRLGDIACSGTGDFEAGELLFVMPEYGTTSAYDETRHNLFNYAAGVRVTSSQVNEPFNSNFLPSTPFSIENINYSGFRLRDRKKLPIPYSVPDEESLLSMVNGTTVEPDRTVYGTSANPRTPGFSTFVSWKYTGVNANPSRRHAFAVTKRHLLAMSTPFHNYAYSSEAPYTKDVSGFATAVTGYTPFTDHQPGDKVYFYDRVQNTVIERTVVASMPFDVASVHNTINKIVNGAYPRLETTYDVTYLPQGCGVVLSYPDGTTYNAPCYNYTVVQEGYNRTIYTSNEEHVFLNEYLPVGGTSDIFEFAEFGDKWLDPYPVRSGEESGIEFADSVTRFKDKFLQNSVYKDNFDGMSNNQFGATSFFELIPYNSTLGLNFGGVTSSTGEGWFNSLMPFNYPIRNLSSYTPLNLYTINNQSGTNSLLLQKTLTSPFLKSIAFENSIGEQLPTSENLRSSQANQSAGVVVYPSSRDVIVVTTETPLSVSGPSIPPKEVDPSLPESSISDQFYYLPSAARNAIAEYFPHGLNNVFYGSLDDDDEFRRLITWHYLTSHYKGLIDGKCSIHLLDEDLPDGVKPISFLDVRRSELHKHELFFDDQMRGFASKSCPPQSAFVPYQYYGRGGPGCESSYALNSFARTFANPYGESMLSFRLFRLGRCGDNVSNVLDPCGEIGETASGPDCRWGVWEIGVGSDIPIYPNGGLDSGLLFSDVSQQNNCYDCWYNANDSRERELPPNVLNTDKLNDVTSDKISWGGSDLPGPLFTYGKSGSPILSKVVTESAYGAMADNYRYLFDYVVTGHKGADLNPGDAVFQNFSGATGICSYPFDSTIGRVFAYSKDTGRLILSLRGSHPILSSDLLLRCNETIRPIGATFGTTAGYIERASYANPCSTSPTDTQGGFQFKHELGKTGYAYALKQTGLPYPNDREVSTWFEVQRGGPRVFGLYWPFGLWYEGWLEEPILNSKDDTCSFVESTDPIPSSNALYLGTHNMGMFLSDQPVYYRSTNVNDPNRFYYFGKVEDLFYKMLEDFNTANGVTAQYRCTKEILKYDSESNAYNYPNSVVVPGLRTPMPSLTRIYAGVNIRESQFLK